jgi:hypothetical protein
MTHDYTLFVKDIFMDAEAFWKYSPQIMHLMPVLPNTPSGC